MFSELGWSPRSGLPESIRTDLPCGVTNSVPPPPSTSIETICKASSLCAIAGVAMAAPASNAIKIFRFMSFSLSSPRLARSDVFLFAYRKTINRHFVQGMCRRYLRRRESRLVGRIRKMLGFEGQGGVVDVRLAPLAHAGLRTLVVAENLHAGLGGQHFHDPAGFGILQPCRGAQRSGLAADHEIDVHA